MSDMPKEIFYLDIGYLNKFTRGEYQQKLWRNKNFIQCLLKNFAKSISTQKKK